MADAYAVWAAGRESSKAKSVRAFWPELAEALDGRTAAAGPDADPQPDCGRCGPRYGYQALALARNDAGQPRCGRCAADEGLSRSKHRVRHWQRTERKITP